MKKNSFINGALIATLAIVITKFLGIVYVIPFYSIIGEENIALYGYAYTIYNLFLALSTVGIPPAMSKLISEYNTLGYYKTKERAYKLGKRLLISLGIILFIVMFLGAPFIANQIMGDNVGGNSKESITLVIRVISSAILVVPFLSVTKGYLQGHKFISASSISQVIEQIIRIIVILLGSYLCVKVFKTGVVSAVSVAVFGATLGALVALIYLLVKIRKNKKDFIQVNENGKEKDITDRQIIKKLLIYSVPFISFGLALSVYEYIDMTSIIKILTSLGFDTVDAESILGVINTTGNKLNSVVLAISTGLMTSLVPNITSSYVKKDEKDVRKKVSQAFIMLIYVTLPMTVGLSFLAKPVFYAFYGPSSWGPEVFCISIFVAFAVSLFTTSASIVQSLNKFKNVFISIFAGIIIKLVLQYPLMLLFDEINLYPFWGSTIATIIGFSVSVLINFVVIHKVVKLNLKEFILDIFKCLYPLIIMVIVLVLFNNVMAFNLNTRLSAIITIGIYSVLGAIIYLLFTAKNGTFNKIFGNRIIKKKKYEV